MRVNRVMALLERTNPAATGASVILWAILGAIFAAVLVFLRLRLAPLLDRYLVFALIAAAAAGAGIGALVEWQLDDGDEGEKATDAVPAGGVWDRELDHEFSNVRRDT
jgi:hypothetical protein